MPASRSAGLMAYATVLLLAGAAFASDVADEAEFHFQRGLKLYSQRRYEDALASFYASNRLAPTRAAQRNIAAALEELQRFPEAFRAYAELERMALNPGERAEIDKAVARLRPKLALVRVESDPPGAT